MAMQSIDLDLYQIAVILPLKRDYETAARCLDQVFLRSSLQSTGAEYTLGRVGLHHVVLVTGLDNTSAADSVAVVYPDLLEAFSSIRVGFLVGVDAIAPYDGCAKAGDVVVGLPQSHESGIAHCDLGKSRDQKRLCITGNWGKPPGFVQSAVDHTLSYRCLPTCIFEAYLDQPDTLIDYEAFSYAWGNNEKSEAVIVDKRVLPVTENLHMALQHLRQEDIDRILWVDAVCIDQSNVAERGHQVTYMGSIYERANNVIVWLGSASEDAGLLISALNMLQHQTSSQAFRTAKRTDADWRYVWDKLQEKPSPSQRVRHLNSGLQELTGKSWFTRVWILQEVAKARRAQIHCTAGIVDTKLFALAPWLLRTHVPPQSQAILDIMPGPSRQSSWWSKERPLQELLWKFRECEATDPRDRVYALLGISSIADESIKPDYSKSERQVLRDVCDHLFGGLEAPVDLSLIYSIAQLQTELGILSVAVLEPRTARWISPGKLRRSLNGRGHVRWAEGIRKLAREGLGRSSLAFLLTRLDDSPNVAPRLLHEGVPLRKDTLATLLDPKLETDWGGMARTSLIAIRVGKDTLHLLFEHHGPGSSICRSILNEAILAGEETFSFSISSFNPAPERLKKFLYSSIPDTETLEELPISNVETLPEKLLASCF
ncbi:HET domain-containing protein [Fusarium keratoplasticum]|uniref:HET domain-containing protein n=1 Tax=Fusarium keratoplasticum TaxID=1328300 RepID=A0ACC0RBE5_9HYPO|nr:HET domain-containing protein [Fusarium keratoplasticum]KAI8683441.1 HET domain-containing protein [Fusarium keratoplasticum]